ncbi:MAG: hypothetical protein J6T16_03795 [Opitutales bacterium]|nr:hypothetical protein [Opitutales bacterium]
MAAAKNRENIWVSLGVNIVLPTLILMKAQKWLVGWGWIEKEAANPLYFFLAALSLPLAYGVCDLAKRRKLNLFSAFGILNVLLTGTIGLFELSREWIIAKEAGIPALLGLAVLVSALTSRPLAKVLIYNDAVLDTKKVGAALEERGNTQKFEEALKFSTMLVSLSFFASAAIQFFLACAIYTRGATPEEFNAQVGQMTWISYLAVLLPCMVITVFAFVKIANAIKNLAGMEFEEALAAELRETRK